MIRTPSYFLCLFAAIGVTNAAWAQVSNVSPELLDPSREGPRRVIVQLVAGASIQDGGNAAQDAIASAQDSVIAALGDRGRVVRRFRTLPGLVVSADRAGILALAESPLVASIHEDRLYMPALKESVPLIGASSLFANGVEGTGWRIALLDTGVEKTHSFFQGAVVAEACFSTTSPDIDGLGTTSSSYCPNGTDTSFSVTNDPGAGTPCPDSGCEHGTVAAGVAVGTELGTNYLFSGVARRAGIISIKVASRVVGPACGGPTTRCVPVAFEGDVAAALDWVAMLAGPGNTGHIAAANMNMTASTTSSGNCDALAPVFKTAVDNLRARGIPTIVPSGNNANPNGIAIPACVSTVISTAASSKDDKFQGFSNRSPLLSLVAPGVSIYTSSVGDTFGTFSHGTSLAAAHTAGAWALLKSVFPGVSVDTALLALRGTGVQLPITDPNTLTTASYPRIAVDKAAGSMGPAGSPTAVRATAVGNTVTITWAPPFTPTALAGYHVEFATPENGANIVAIVNAGPTFSLAATVPNGRYLVRVRSVLPNGTRSVASNDVPLQVGPAVSMLQPLPPRDLRAQVDGQTVSLFWNAPLGTAPVAAYLIDVSSIPNFTSNFGTYDTNSTALTAVARNVQPGTYFVRARARNQYGASLGSNEVTVTVSGTSCASIPPPTNLTQTVVGSLVTLSWNPPVISGAINGYVVEAGSAPGTSNVVTANIGNQTVVGTSVGAGIYYVRVRARTAACGLTGPSNEVVVTVQ